MFSDINGRKIKISFKSETRALIIKQYNYTQLLDHLNDTLEIPSSQNYGLQYINSSGDIITIETEKDFINAIEKGIAKYEFVPKEIKQYQFVIKMSFIHQMRTRL